MLYLIRHAENKFDDWFIGPDTPTDLTMGASGPRGTINAILPHLVHSI
jgi:hypothetical protein